MSAFGGKADIMFDGQKSTFGPNAHHVLSEWTYIFKSSLVIPMTDERMTEMKIVSINDAPAVRDADGILRCQLTDLSRIIDNIDTAEGRNDALRAYIYALRDLQHAHDVNAYEENGAAIDAAQALVAKTFDQLIVAQLTLNRSAG
jgi:hypothetical protein